MLEFLNPYLENLPRIAIGLLLLGLTSIVNQIAPDKIPASSFITTLEATPAAEIVLGTAVDSATSEVKKKITEPIEKAKEDIPWGTTEKLDEHVYRTYVKNDEAMGTPDEILAALNNYRRNHRLSGVSSDDGICRLAQMRAEQQKNDLDVHKGFEEYFKNPAHWQELNITGVGENASIGYVQSGTHLIEWVFDADSEHRNNQLNPQWNLACAGISNTTVNIIFAKR